ncbi:MAG: 3-methyl-2-oxobutanoate hydroxymethyltransferase [Planctomycetota bacterium]|nr:MAG: 3-methyl-2-oxobutanoate hydroxymethyltransferase [Planctomycetota bacterium]
MTEPPDSRPYGAGPPPPAGEIQAPSKVTAPGIRARKGSGRPILALTAYDSPTARLVDEAGFDLILVGDSMANVVLGHATTLKITLDQIISATRAVKRAVDRPLVVSDMPFGSYHTGVRDTLVNAVRLVREGGAQAVKLEGGRSRAELVRELVRAEIPVLGHIGLLPQSYHSAGGYRVQGRTAESARALLEDAQALEDAGAFAVVLEGVPAPVAAAITARISIPTIGIGAGPGCDGQILVFHDVVGFTTAPPPKFVRRYADLAGVVREALGRLAADIRAGAFPGPEECYSFRGELPAEWRDEAPAARPDPRP